jgi:hypothetical protein
MQAEKEAAKYQIQLNHLPANNGASGNTAVATEIALLAGEATTKRVIGHCLRALGAHNVPAPSNAAIGDKPSSIQGSVGAVTGKCELWNSLLRLYHHDFVARIGRRAGRSRPFSRGHPDIG